MSKVKLIALGFHGLMQMVGVGVLFFGFANYYSQAVVGYLLVTGLVMCVIAYNKLIVQIYLKDASYALKTAKKAKKRGVMDKYKLQFEQ